MSNKNILEKKRGAYLHHLAFKKIAYTKIQYTDIEKRDFMVSKTLFTFLMFFSLISMQSKSARDEVNNEVSHMSSRGILTAPKGLSMLAAFRALYNAAKPLQDAHNPLANRVIRDDNHAAQVLLTQCSWLECGQIDGRSIETNFHFYSELNVAEYDWEHGQGAAKRALDEAAAVNPKSDSKKLKDVCFYFEGISAGEVDSDVLSTFKRCQRLKEGARRVAAFQEELGEETGHTNGCNHWFKNAVTRCTASYVISGGISHEGVSCKRALGHMKDMERSYRDLLNHAPHTWIESMTITRGLPRFKAPRNGTVIWSASTPHEDIALRVPKNTEYVISASVPFKDLSLSSAAKALEGAMNDDEY